MGSETCLVGACREVGSATHWGMELNPIEIRPTQNDKKELYAPGDSPEEHHSHIVGQVHLYWYITCAILWSQLANFVSDASNTKI